MFDKANRVITELSRARLVALSLGGVGVMGAIDFATGFELAFSIFYLGPVALATWYGSRGMGFAVAVLASATWLTVDWLGGHPYTHPAIPVWNSLVRLGFFLITATLLDAARVRLDVEGRLARTDPVTGALNGRAFRERLEFGIAFAARERQPLTVAYVDIDDFKRVNDTHGHADGDRVLRIVARMLTESIRRSDVAARLGGDEFILLLPSTDLAGAAHILGKARESLHDALRAAGREVTCSIGAVTFRSPPASAEEAIRAADAVMYKVKGSGKNGVAFETLDPDPTGTSRRRAGGGALQSADR